MWCLIITGDCCVCKLAVFKCAGDSHIAPDRLAQEKAALEVQLRNVSFFQFSERKEKKEKISSIETAIKELKQQGDEFTAQLNNEVEKLKRTDEEYADTREKQLRCCDKIVSDINSLKHVKEVLEKEYTTIYYEVTQLEQKLKDAEAVHLLNAKRRESEIEIIKRQISYREELEQKKQEEEKLRAHRKALIKQFDLSKILSKCIFTPTIQHNALDEYLLNVSYAQMIEVINTSNTYAASDRTTP